MHFSPRTSQKQFQANWVPDSWAPGKLAPDNWDQLSALKSGKLGPGAQLSIPYFTNSNLINCLIINKRSNEQNVCVR